MKIVLGIGAAVIVCIAVSQARAQQPPEDGKVAIYRQMLTRANDELASVGGQLQAAQIENAQLKAQIEKLKPADTPLAKP